MVKFWKMTLSKMSFIKMMLNMNKTYAECQYAECLYVECHCTDKTLYIVFPQGVWHLYIWQNDTLHNNQNMMTLGAKENWSGKILENDTRQNDIH
jgi:hypothetical protein